MDDSGAQALEDDEIQEIPTVIISSEHEQNSLQCSVCLEYFKMNDAAKVLPCNHHYHEHCIVPWLGLRGTCPDCRRNLVPQIGNDDNLRFDIDEETLSGYESAHSNTIQSYVSVVRFNRFPENNRRGAIRIAESVNGNVYFEDIEDESSSSDVPIHTLNDLYSNDITNTTLTSLSSNDVTASTRSPVTSPLSVTDDESEFRYPVSFRRRWGASSTSPGPGSGSLDFTSDTTIDDDTIVDTTIPSSPSIYTVSEVTSDDDMEILSENSAIAFGQRSLSEISSDSLGGHMLIHSEPSISSTSETSTYDDY